MKTKLSESKRYTGAYRGIRFLISHHGYGNPESYAPNGHWCFYLYINEKQLIDEYKKDFILNGEVKEGKVSHNYYSSKIADIDFHCGITYYNKESGADGEDVIIKIGCDYSHLYDEGQIYNEYNILHDVENAIDSMITLYPEIKICSSNYGGYYEESEGEFRENGSFLAFEEKDRWEQERGNSKSN